MNMRKQIWFAFAVAFVLFSASGVFAQNAPVVIRAGHFPNITHSQAVIGKANGWFEKAMAPDARVDWKMFNAGPSAIEAIFAG